MNRLVLAVAGGRKTQSLIDLCTGSTADRRVLIVTYTQRNQEEIVRRIGCAGIPGQVDVQGWFSFLMSYWVRPYLPYLFHEQRLRGLNFDGDPGMYAKGKSRFVDGEGRAYRRHLAQLALHTNDASKGAVLDRLGRIYNELYIDEVQDLNGYDLEVLRKLFDSGINTHMVGDTRQALLLTNAHDPKHKQFKGINIGKWFEKEQEAGRLVIEHQSITWRCNQRIADFADGIFPSEWNFPPTVSRNAAITGHDGVFAVAPEHVYDYVATFRPLCLRPTAATARDLDLDFTNIGIAKGMGAPRVLIAPTGNVIKWLQGKGALSDVPSCSLYVAVTRAEASVAFVATKPETLGLTVWTPG